MAHLFELPEVAQAIEVLTPFMPRMELSVLRLSLKGEEGAFFASKLQELANVVHAMPKTYETDDKDAADVQVHLHYFKGGSDWYITEKDKSGKGTEQCFGYSVLNGDIECAELGYISIDELVRHGVELDLYWQRRSLADVQQAIRS